MTEEMNVIAHLEGLRIPVLDLLNRLHVTQIVWKFVKFLGSVCQSNGKFLFSSIIGKWK
jgi:hypothetical protein